MTLIRAVEEKGQAVLPNFIEAKDVDEANIVDLGTYRFERYSETKNVYIFVKRAR